MTFISSSQKKIIQLLADGEFHSGTEIAGIIGVSRSAVCKQINNLNDIGLEFNAISGKGYRLEHALQLLSQTEIEKQLSTPARELIKEFEIHDCITSTNRYLFEKANLNDLNGLVCFSEYQTAGKGRRGREWVSPFGSNIYLSILWRFQNGPASISGLSLAIGVIIIRALNECGIDGVGLKWPNDIYWQGKKLAGILIEISGESSGPCHAVVGLGLNFYIPKQQGQLITQDWVDLNHIITDKATNIRNQLAAVLLNHLMPTLANFEKQTLNEYLDEWRKYDCMQGKKVDIFMGKNVFSGTVEGIDDDGLLLLSDSLGVIKTFASGEVSFRQL